MRVAACGLPESGQIVRDVGLEEATVNCFFPEQDGSRDCACPQHWANRSEKISAFEGPPFSGPVR